MTSWMLLAQVEPELGSYLDRIMWAQITMAAVMVLCMLVVIAAGFAVLLFLRRAMRKVEEAKDDLLPHVTPVLSRASTIADDVRHITAGVRDEAEGINETVHDLVDRTRSAVDSLEERLHRFGLVLEVVQEQAESLLMDAAATARGVHTTARALREDRKSLPQVRHRRVERPSRKREES